MEEHMLTHIDVKSHNCVICGKEFVAKWRLDKHIKSHSERVKYCHYFNNNKACPYQNVGCKFRHADSPLCKYRSTCTFNLCQFKHILIEEVTREEEYCEEVGLGSLGSDSTYDEDCLTDYETTDFETVTEIELRKNMYSECGACSKELTVENSFKCKKCGEAKHRSDCNKWFNTVKKHHYCGGCVYDFKPEENAS